MWYQAFEFYDRHPPASPDDITAFRTPLPEAERANALNYLEPYSIQLSATGYCLPAHFYIPDELMQLWQYSVHGGITGNGQDFGYFSTGGNRVLLFRLPILVLRARFAADCIRWRRRVLLLRFRAARPFNCDERLRLG